MQISLGETNSIIIARAGGGGSSSGGSFSGGGFSSGTTAGVVAAGSSSDGSMWPALLFFVFILLLFYLITKYKKARGLNEQNIPDGFIKKGSAEDIGLSKYFDSAEKTFMTFQKAWSGFDLAKIKAIATENYYKKMTLELNILKNYGRQNIVENPIIIATAIKSKASYSKGFDILFVASSNDRLVDFSNGKDIFTDQSSFSEIWHFVKGGKKYLLDGITQTTEEASKYDKSIAGFAKDNGFYYDPDFGWLMMPTRGAIFGAQGFGSADINNHVVGYYEGKIVEFYSYEPTAGAGIKPFVVAQAILPKKYNNILVTEKSWYGFRPKAKGLERVETESNEFNKKFAVWASKPEQATSFELLATNFMEKIYKQSYEINIEVVDNVLYIYSPSSNIEYSEMLQVLSWAFEEMKM